MGALVAILAAFSTFAACGTDPSSTDSAKKQQPILTERSVADVWEDYDKLNSAAMVKAGPPSYDGTAYDVVDVGPTLDKDVAVAKANKVDGGRRGEPFSTTSTGL